MKRVAINLERRLAAVESRRNAAIEPRRWVAEYIEGQVYFAKSTVSRQRQSSGRLLEVVILDGRLDSVTPEELESFIASFPIKPTY